jgi:Fe(3+) dicitrate transport protein
MICGGLCLVLPPQKNILFELKLTKYHLRLAALFIFCAQYALAQVPADTARTSTLPAVEIHDYPSPFPDIKRLPNVEGTQLNFGKKNEVIMLQKLNANLSVNNARQAFSKVPGIHIWENEGSGQQINIGMRGLSPNRSFDLLSKQNGIDIQADPYGNPDTYYTPPLEAVREIEIVRGAGSLQYGPQLGGLVDYKLRTFYSDNKDNGAEFSLTGGSYGLVNLFVGISGRKEKFFYNAYAHQRNYDGWRQNGRMRSGSYYVQFGANITHKLRLLAEYTRLDYTLQQAGGLTDLQFAASAQQSFRARNWFGIVWNVPAVSLDWRPNAHFRLQARVFGLVGDRNSVGNTNDVTDANTTDNFNAIRRVDIDQYRNIGAEVRAVYSYNLGSIKNDLAVGVRYYNGQATRLRGNGTPGDAIDYGFSEPTPSRYNLRFSTQNKALFAENAFHLTDRLSVVPGIRLETITTRGSGTTSNISRVDQNLTRAFVLGGIGARYKASANTEFYANYTQAYRPVEFSQYYPSAATDTVLSALSDARGVNADFGIRGSHADWLMYDISVFYVGYFNRLGSFNQTFGLTNFRVLAVVGNSDAYGVESYAEANLTRALFGITPERFAVRVFNTLAFVNATYSSGVFQGNWVENAPRWVNRAGLTFSLHDKYALTVNYSYVDKVFFTADNAIAPSANGNSGLIPGYNILDITFKAEVLKWLWVQGGINNATDARFFTRRATGYPGPGIIPSDGRVFLLGLGARF